MNLDFYEKTSLSWIKLGQIFCPSFYSQKHPKLISHAANPLAIHLENDIFRIFYSGRDIYNRSSIGAVDIDIVNQKIKNYIVEPIFIHGDESSFFSHGVSVGNYYNIKEDIYIPFMGWKVEHNQHWKGEIGRLKLNLDFQLELSPKTPFLSFDDIDPVSLSYPFVLQENADQYKMWYGSTVTWDAGNNEMLHIINYAESNDGNHWVKKGISLPYEINRVQAFSKPSVFKDSNNTYNMWFSYRSGTGQKYRIGYAQSEDGIDWSVDLENVGITVSNFGWDSEMIAYPYVFEHKEQIYMLYNGNGYGKTGFGLAILDAKM